MTKCVHHFHLVDQTKRDTGFILERAYYWFESFETDDFASWRCVPKDLPNGDRDGQAQNTAHEQARVYVARNGGRCVVVEAWGEGDDGCITRAVFEAPDEAHVRRYDVKHQHCEAGFAFCVQCKYGDRQGVFDDNLFSEIDVEHREHMSTAQRLRAQALELLGPFCIVCYESDSRVLQIDHVFGGGSIERRERSSFGILKDVLQHGANKYQVLCPTCNWKKRLYNNEVGGRRKKAR